MIRQTAIIMLLQGLGKVLVFFRQILEKGVCFLPDPPVFFPSEAFLCTCRHQRYDHIHPLIHSFYTWNRVQIHAASAEAAGKITSSFSSWLFRLYPYFLPSYTGATSGQ